MRTKKHNYIQIYQDIKSLGIDQTAKKYSLSKPHISSIRMYGDTFTSACRSQLSQGLKSYTPRDLMQELASRGYKGTLHYTQDININDF